MAKHLSTTDGRDDRRYSPAYKLKILREAERCTRWGEIKNLLRREGLHSSLLSRWRRKFNEGGETALEPKKATRNPDKPKRRFSTSDPLAKVVLIEQLRDLARKLKRTPSSEDVEQASKLGECVSPKTFFKVFGSYKAALRKAGLLLNHGPELKRADMIADLRRLAKDLGRSLGKADIKKASEKGKCASTHQYLKVFGTIGAALREAGVRKFPYDKTELIRQLRQLAAELGQIPHTNQIAEASRKGKCAGIQTFMRMFGSMGELRRALGADVVNRPKKYPRDQLVLYLRGLAKELGESPTYQRVDALSKGGKHPSGSAICREFGSWSKALLAAGLRRNVVREYTRSTLIEQLQRLATKLGRTPQSDDIVAASKARESASLPTFRSVFGSFGAALREAGFEPTRFYG